MRGGEKCLEALLELYPSGTVYTLFHEPGRVSAAIERHPIRTSFVQRLPAIFRRYRWYLPLFPAAVESFDLSAHDLVVSTSHCVAKGVKKRSGAVHVCYCFTPMRYAWGFFDEYFGAHGQARGAIRLALDSLRVWDRRASARVDRFVAISRHVQERIRRFYGRESDVVYPPADTAFYTRAALGREDFYLVVSALVPYKRVDVAVRFFTKTGKKLVVIGSGPERARLEAMAGPGIVFLGWQSDESLREHYRRAKALVFPGEEDFGIVPVEAQACGCPVIALGKGGALETVIDGKTGVFFAEADDDSLAGAVARFEKLSLDPAVARANAERFSRPRFQAEMHAVLQEASGAGVRSLKETAA